MDAPLNTSVILLVAVALWLIWVAPYLLRRRSDIAAAPQGRAAFPAVPAPRQQASMSMETKQSQETHMMTSTPTAAVRSVQHGTAGARPLQGAKQQARTPAPLKINYGRTAVALLGLLALLAVPVTAALWLLGLIVGAVPAAAAAVFVLCLAVLRALAVRSRKSRLDAAFRAAMGPTTAASRTASRPAAGTAAAQVPARPAVAVFDAHADAPATAAAPVKAVKPLTAVELRNAALAVAAKGAADAQVATTRTVGELETWQPVEVPKPSYVAAAKADRPAPAPLVLPQAPKASARTSIRATESAAASKATEEAAAAAAADKTINTASAETASAGAMPASAAPEGKDAPAKPAAGQAAKPAAPSGKARPTHGLSNLDDVLQRRRA